MKRLTESKDFTDAEIIACLTCKKSWDNYDSSQDCGMCDHFTDVVNKLADYEDMH